MRDNRTGRFRHAVGVAVVGVLVVEHFEHAVPDVADPLRVVSVHVNFSLVHPPVVHEEVAVG